MGKTLIIAEKPSVGRDIAKVVEAKTKGDGCIFGDDYIVTWAIGHLITLCNPEELDPKYKEWTFETLPIIPKEMKKKVISKAYVKKQYNIVHELLNSDEVSDIICATDSGREGELIFRLIYDYAKCTKPFRRLWISSMTDTAIRKGLDTMKDGSEYDNLYASAKCRAEADWLVGMNGSRGFTLTYERLLSVGRVQSPTLAILVERELERRNFVPETYYVLSADFDGYTGKWFDPEAKKEIYRITPEQYKEMKTLADTLPGKTATIVNKKTNEVRIKPPLLYDLTQLQRDANRSFGWPASKTLRVAQNLYEKKKVITYPRTDSKFLSGDMYPSLKGRLEKLQQSPWSTISKKALASERNIFGRVINDRGVTDHHAIIPTGSKAAMGKLKDDDAKLFNLIARRFVAVFFDDQLLEKTELDTKCEEQLFKTRATRVVEPGWAAVYGKKKNKQYDPETDNLEQSDIPQLQIGDTRITQSALFEEKETLPPPPYTEASLLAAMENAGKRVDDEALAAVMKDSGLGTPATRAAIIDRLIQVKYLKRARRTLMPTDKGIALVSVMPDVLSKPETTAIWEHNLAMIGTGEKNADEFMDEIRSMVIELVNKSTVKLEHANFPEEPKRIPMEEREVLGICPSCGGNIMENTKAYFCTNWRIKKCKFTVWKNMLSRDKEIKGPDITPDMMKTIMDKKELKLEKGKLVLLEKGPPFVEYQKED